MAIANRNCVLGQSDRPLSQLGNQGDYGTDACKDYYTRLYRLYRQGKKASARRVRWFYFMCILIMTTSKPLDQQFDLLIELLSSSLQRLEEIAADQQQDAILIEKALHTADLLRTVITSVDDLKKTVRDSEETLIKARLYKR